MSTKTNQNDNKGDGQSETGDIFSDKILSPGETNKVPALQQLALLGVLMFLLFSGAITPKVIGLFTEKQDTTPAAVAYPETQPELIPVDAELKIKPFSEVQIVGKTAYVWDVQGQRALYEKESNKQVPLASVTKLMTALVASELLEETASIAINRQAIQQDGDSGLLSGETFNRQSLTDLVLMSSSNDGAYAMAAAAGEILQTNNGPNAFVHAMNIRAKELKLHDTYFKNPTGLDLSPQEGGAYGSAKDMAFLMEFIVLNESDLLTFTQENEAHVYSEDGIYHDAENTNYYIDEIPGLIGSKTGYTDLAGGNLVIAFDAGLNRPIIIAVLGSTRHERFTDVIALVKEAQNYISQE
ncbi:MAG: D-alanyl-D-alanine carboxypeptidase (penicillin-binding protein 5/6) [Acidimicrobiales bacterium]|jgi:D-alanyl-D-alanine carboxypeptidase (penicillin-binding protein 5/6)